MSALPTRIINMVTSSDGYLSDDRCAVLLGPEGGGRTLAGSGAASIAPAAFCHPRRQQTGSTVGQLTTAGANQRDLSDLGSITHKMLESNLCFFISVRHTNKVFPLRQEMDYKRKPKCLVAQPLQ